MVSPSEASPWAAEKVVYVPGTPVLFTRKMAASAVAMLDQRAKRRSVVFMLIVLVVIGIHLCSLLDEAGMQMLPISDQAQRVGTLAEMCNVDLTSIKLQRNRSS